MSTQRRAIPNALEIDSEVPSFLASWQTCPCGGQENSRPWHISLPKEIKKLALQLYKNGFIFPGL